ncbi:hypothetical protein TRVL_09841 [Trypanosoma vivax]|nr:hypothetical protein TRVL_09841 [Trypanosoma vivax]
MRSHCANDTSSLSKRDASTRSSYPWLTARPRNPLSAPVCRPTALARRLGTHGPQSNLQRLRSLRNGFRCRRAVCGATAVLRQETACAQFLLSRTSEPQRECALVTRNSCRPGARPILATKPTLFRSASWRWRALRNSPWCLTGQGRQAGQTSRPKAGIHAKQAEARAARLALIRGAGPKLLLSFKTTKGAESVRPTRCASGCAFRLTRKACSFKVFLMLTAKLCLTKIPDTL